jgi:tetratricopeptide (TPR) repeat protein
VSFSVTLIVLAGSVGWAVRDGVARRARTAEQVNLALKDAAVLQGQEKWGAALATVERAEALLAEGGGAAELYHRAQELRKDLEMAARLDDLRLHKSYGVESIFGGGDLWAVITYDREFQGYGIGVLTDPPERVADWIGARSIREQLVAALDDWILIQKDAGVRARLLVIAQLADANEWRNRMRQAVVQNDRRTLEELAARPEVAGFPPATAYLLGQALANAGLRAKAVQVLGAVQHRHPQDFWLNYQLGILILAEFDLGVPQDQQVAQKGYQFLWSRADVAAGYLRAALVARPDYSMVYLELARALPGPEHLDEVVALNRKAIELSSTYFDARSRLGGALHAKGSLDELEEVVAEFRDALHMKLDLAAKGQLDEAIAELREANRLNKDLPETHHKLGNALATKGRLDEAIVEYREAIRLRGDFPQVRTNLGMVLSAKGQLDEAIAEYREALRLNKDDAAAHLNSGVALRARGRLDEAIAEFREALRLQPDNFSAHNKLGVALEEKGRTDEAIAALQKAIRIRKDDASAHYNLANALAVKGWLDKAVAEYREAIRLNQDLPKAHYNLGFVLQKQGRLDEAAAEYREAIRLKMDYASGHENLYNAACYDALAGCGQNAANLDERLRAHFRRQALDRLRACLETWGKLLEKEPDAAQPVVVLQMQHWLADPNLAGVRGEKALAKLPEGERPAWQKLWAGVAETLARAQGKTVPPTELKAGRRMPGP